MYCIFNFCTIFKAFTFYIWKGKPHICSAEIRTCLLLFPDPIFLSLLFECCVLFIPGSFFKVVVCTAQMKFHIQKCHAWDRLGWKYHSWMENGFQMELKCILFFLLVIEKYFWLTWAFLNDMFKYLVFVLEFTFHRLVFWKARKVLSLERPWLMHF